jgi:hypothetical protein
MWSRDASVAEVGKLISLLFPQIPKRLDCFWRIPTVVIVGKGK